MNRTERLKHFQIEPEDPVSVLLTAKYMTVELQKHINSKLHMPPSTEYYIALKRRDWLSLKIYLRSLDIKLRRGQLYRLQSITREFFFAHGIVTLTPCTPFEIKQVITKLTQDIPELSNHLNIDKYGE